VEDGPQRLCPRCGAPFAEGQEYCLDCGLRLDPGTGVFARWGRAWRERFGWYPGDWIWPVLLGLVVAVIGGTVAVVLADSGSGGNGTLVATHGQTVRQPVTPPVTATVALPTVPSGTPTTTGPPETPTQPPPPSSTTPSPGGLTAWPASQNGYTVVLESVPVSAGRSLAVDRARAASRAGLPQVGILNSSLYSSLHPGYWVVFSGIYASNGAANSAAGAAQAKGFGSAYSRQITR
jgi:hypothetical protein